MRAFIVLCLVATSCADKLGYNYKPVAHSDFGLSFTPGDSSVHVSNGGGSHVSGTSDVGNGFGGGSYNGGDHAYAPHVQLEKEFYTFTANEDDFAVPHVDNQVVTSAKKSVRVIFIKGPENHGLENAAISLAKNIAEQKTAIYVLQKQTDLGSLSHKLNVINSNINHKPEVHFVKYRTHEDAISAQKAIQSQYDSLGGVSSNYNGGEAKVLNFASKAPVASIGSSGHIDTSGPHGISGSHGSSGHFVSGGSTGLTGNSAPSSTYLPS